MCVGIEARGTIALKLTRTWDDAHCRFTLMLINLRATAIIRYLFT